MDDDAFGSVACMLCVFAVCSVRCVKCTTSNGIREWQTGSNSTQQPSHRTTHAEKQKEFAQCVVTPSFYIYFVLSSSFVSINNAKCEWFFCFLVLLLFGGIFFSQICIIYNAMSMWLKNCLQAAPGDEQHTLKWSSLSVKRITMFHCLQHKNLSTQARVHFCRRRPILFGEPYCLALWFINKTLTHGHAAGSGFSCDVHGRRYQKSVCSICSVKSYYAYIVHHSIANHRNICFAWYRTHFLHMYISISSRRMIWSWPVVERRTACTGNCNGFCVQLFSSFYWLENTFMIDTQTENTTRISGD